VPGQGFRVIYPDIPDNYRSRLDLQWPIFTFGRLESGVRAAAAEAGALGKDVASARTDLRLEITRAYWAYLTASDAVGVVEEALKWIEAYAADVRNRLNVGLVPPSDLLSVEAQRSHQQVLLIDARNTRDVAAADLARLVGLPPETALQLEARLQDLPPLPPPAGALLSEARAARPDRQALEQRIVAAGERREAARAERRPLVSVGGGVDYARPNPRIFPRLGEFRGSWDASVNVSWPLWDGGRARADVAEAAANERAVSERLEDFDTTLAVEVRQRRLDLESALAAIKAAGDAVDSAAEARRMVGERYTAGVATNTEVLDAQVALLQAELDRTRAFASAHLAAARLDRAVGK
jgi:outer membrane protein